MKNKEKPLRKQFREKIVKAFKKNDLSKYNRKFFQNKNYKKKREYNGKIIKEKYSLVKTNDIEGNVIFNYDEIVLNINVEYITVGDKVIVMYMQCRLENSIQEIPDVFIIDIPHIVRDCHAYRVKINQYLEVTSFIKHFELKEVKDILLRYTNNLRLKIKNMSLVDKIIIHFFKEFDVKININYCEKSDERGRIGEIMNNNGIRFDFYEIPFNYQLIKEENLVSIQIDGLTKDVFLNKIYPSFGPIRLVALNAIPVRFQEMAQNEFTIQILQIKNGKFLYEKIKDLSNMWSTKLVTAITYLMQTRQIDKTNFNGYLTYVDQLN
jgi:hypothetical protein